MSLESSIAFAGSLVALAGLIGGMITSALAVRFFVKEAFHNDYEKFDWPDMFIAMFCAGLFVLFTLGTIWWIAAMTGAIHVNWGRTTTTTEIFISK